MTTYIFFISLNHPISLFFFKKYPESSYNTKDLRYLSVYPNQGYKIVVKAVFYVLDWNIPSDLCGVRQLKTHFF